MLEGCTGQVQRPGTKAVYLKEFVFVCFFFFFFLLVGNFHIGNQAASYIHIYITLIAVQNYQMVTSFDTQS